MKTNFRPLAHGRATDIPFDLYMVGNHRVPCPECSRGKHDKTLGITIKEDGTGVSHCFRCNTTQTYKPRTGGQIRRTASIAPTRLSQVKRTTLSAEGQRIWDACLPISGTARNYLESRGCSLPPADGDLRWHPDLPQERSGYRGAALVGLVTNIQTGEPMSLHRTWITDTGKAPIPLQRKHLPGHALAGGCIRLWSDDAVTMTLGIAEGIENALILALAIKPVWALIDAGNMSKFPVLSGLEALFVGVDQDDAGRNAAATVIHRYLTAGVQVFQSVQPVGDLNDFVRGRK